MTPRGVYLSRDTLPAMRNDKLISLRLPTDLLAALDKRAESEGLPRGEVVRRAIADGLGASDHAKALKRLEREVARLRSAVEGRKA